ncbi:pyranose dehydrogenase 3 [Rhypophila decipiens]
MAAEYDFIIVGSGPAGGALAYFLAQSPKKPKILILEAGSDNSDNNLRVDGKRWLTFMNKDMNYGYKTAPQPDANNREIDYSRGRGLGGSSAVNFGVFTVGAKDDYDEWSRLVEDPGESFFGWDRTKARLKKLETFHGRAPVTLENGTKYVSPRLEDHGSDGPLQVGYPAEWEDTVAPFLDQSENFGFPLNPDHNSGNPLGMSALISSAHNGRRSTARDLLQAIESLPNVTILTSCPVQRLVFDPSGLKKNPKVIGVESNSTKYLATKEVILCAGSLDTPKILMHSGIGPADQLSRFFIPLVHQNEAIGQNLRDHGFCPLVYLRKTPPLSDRARFYSSPTAQEEALAQWSKDGTGPWAKFACQTGIGFFKLPKLVASPEFLALLEDEKSYLNKPTIPHWEIFSHFPIHWFMPEAFPTLPENTMSAGEVDASRFDYTCLLVFLYNAQARGSVSLQSSDPNVPLVFDPKFLSHPYDRRAAVEALREALRYTRTERFIEEHKVHDEGGVIAAPPTWDSKGEPGEEPSDEDLLDYWRNTISSSWHMSGTVKMGRAGEKDAVVDRKFRLIGVEGLRVADMSVAPVLLSGHTQAGAYLTGVAAAERILEDYGL